MSSLSLQFGAAKRQIDEMDSVDDRDVDEDMPRPATPARTEGPLPGQPDPVGDAAAALIEQFGAAESSVGACLCLAFVDTAVTLDSMSLESLQAVHALVVGNMPAFGAGSDIITEKKTQITRILGELNAVDAELSLVFTRLQTAQDRWRDAKHELSTIEAGNERASLTRSKNELSGTPKEDEVKIERLTNIIMNKQQKVDARTNAVSNAQADIDSATREHADAVTKRTGITQQLSVAMDTLTSTMDAAKKAASRELRNALIFSILSTLLFTSVAGSAGAWYMSAQAGAMAVAAAAPVKAALEVCTQQGKELATFTMSVLKHNKPNTISALISASTVGYNVKRGAAFNRDMSLQGTTHIPDPLNVESLASAAGGMMDATKPPLPTFLFSDEAGGDVGARAARTKLRDRCKTLAFGMNTSSVLGLRPWQTIRLFYGFTVPTAISEMHTMHLVPARDFLTTLACWGPGITSMSLITAFVFLRWGYTKSPDQLTTNDWEKLGKFAISKLAQPPAPAASETSAAAMASEARPSTSAQTRRENILNTAAPPTPQTIDNMTQKLETAIQVITTDTPVPVVPQAAAKYTMTQEIAKRTILSAAGAHFARINWFGELMV